MMKTSFRAASIQLIGLLILAVTHVSPAPAEPPASRGASQPTSRTVKLRIAIAGDATSADFTGWGGAFCNLLDGDTACINQSKSGRSSGSYLSEARWKRCLELRPDYALIQFGHNDQLGRAGVDAVDPKTVYRENLLRYVDEARTAGVQPVIITPMARRQFGPDGKIHSSLAPYADVARSLATERKVPLVDLHARSIELYEKLGPDGCCALSCRKPDGTFDPAHLSIDGANAMASLVADELKKAVPELTEVLK